MVIYTMDYDNLLGLVQNRRSVRRFRPEPVSPEDVHKVLELARFAPSAANAQPWEFVVVRDSATKKSITRSIVSGYAGMRKRDPGAYPEVPVQPHLWTAPVLIVVCGDKRLEQVYPAFMERQVLFRQSLANCIFALQLAAASLGLATAWATIQQGPRETEIKKLLGIPEEYTIDHIVPLGYADEEREARSRALRPVRERARYRRSLESIVHYEHYDSNKFRTDEDIKEFIWKHTVVRIPRSRE